MDTQYDCFKALAEGKKIMHDRTKNVYEFDEGGTLLKNGEPAPQSASFSLPKGYSVVPGGAKPPFRLDYFQVAEMLVGKEQWFELAQCDRENVVENLLEFINDTSYSLFVVETTELRSTTTNSHITEYIGSGSYADDDEYRASSMWYGGEYVYTRPGIYQVQNRLEEQYLSEPQ